MLQLHHVLQSLLSVFYLCNAHGCQNTNDNYMTLYLNKMLSYRRETALQGAL